MSSLLNSTENAVEEADHWFQRNGFPFCAWAAHTDEDIYSPLLLDLNAVYQATVLSFVSHPARLYKVTGQYPQLAYYSYQSYNLLGQPLDSIVDFEMEPAAGKNPYADMTATPATSGTYDLYVTAQSSKNYTNELASSKNGTVPSRWTFLPDQDPVVILILRLYTAAPPGSTWGGVEPPLVQYSDDHGKTWRCMLMCGTKERFVAAAFT